MAEKQEGGACAEKNKKESDVLVEDEELDDLLDSALGEFGRHVPDTKETSPKRPRKDSHDFQRQFLKDLFCDMGEADLPPMGDKDGFDEIFTEEFAKNAEAQMKEALQVLSQDNPELAKQLDSLAKDNFKESGEASSGQQKKEVKPDQNNSDVKGKSQQSCNGSVPEGEVPMDLSSSTEEKKSDTSKQSNLDSTLDEAIRQLQKNMENVGKNDDFSQMFSGLNVGGDGGGSAMATEDGLLAMMEKMMGSLLSKEILYPPLKDFCQQYPDWLAKHKESLSKDDLTRYSEQFQVMKGVCEEYEREKKEDSSEVQHARFEKILEMMHKLQSLGQPPEELLGQNGEMPFEFPQPPLPNAENCSIM